MVLNNDRGNIYVDATSTRAGNGDHALTDKGHPDDPSLLAH